MTDDIDPAPEDERKIELLSITAIYPEAVINRDQRISVSIELPVSPVKPIAVSFVTSDKDTAAPGLATPPISDGEESGRPSRAPLASDVQHLAHLPPLTLQITLPDGYPETTAPVFELSTSPAWLPTEIIRRLIDHGKAFWIEQGGGPILFDFIDYLRQEAEDVFDLADAGDVITMNVGQDVRLALLDFDARAKRQHFEQETFDCGICLTPKKGISCHRILRCGHVFCVQCLQDFYNNCITEGDVASVKCLDPDCGKDKGPPAAEQAGPSRGRKRRKEEVTLSPTELLQIPLEQNVVQRYVDMKRKAQLESDKNVIYCPRKWCQGPARWSRSKRPTSAEEAANSEDDLDEDEPKVWKVGDDETELPPPEERVAICEDCSYAFCRVCLAGWHGELARCWPRKPAELTAEEMASQEYLKNHSSPCPTCNARCQKTMGCNHMICLKCKSHFCYLCSSWLQPENPYQHFNKPGKGCYMQLWVLEEGDGDDVYLQQRRAHPDLEEDEDEDDLILEEEVVFLPPAPEPPRRRDVDFAAQGVIGQGNAGRRQLPFRARNDAAGERARPEPAGGREGLRRFLEMVNNDEEDEWDSDELEDDVGRDGNWDIPVR